MRKIQFAWLVRLMIDIVEANPIDSEFLALDFTIWIRKSERTITLLVQKTWTLSETKKAFRSKLRDVH